MSADDGAISADQVDIRLQPMNKDGGADTNGADGEAGDQTQHRVDLANGGKNQEEEEEEEEEEKEDDETNMARFDANEHTIWIDSDGDEETERIILKQNFFLPYSDHNYDPPDPSERVVHPEEGPFPIIRGLSEDGRIIRQYMPPGYEDQGEEIGVPDEEELAERAKAVAIAAQEAHAVLTAVNQKAPTAPTAPIPSQSTTTVSKTSTTSQQQNPLQKALTDELKGNLNRRPPASIAPTQAVHASPPTASVVTPRPSKTAHWKDMVAIPGVEVSYNSFLGSPTANLPQCCRRAYSEDASPCSDDCLLMRIDKSLNLENFINSKNKKIKFLLHITDNQYVCIGCHSKSGKQVMRSAQVSSKPMDIRQGARHMASDDCKFTKKAKKECTENVFLFVIDGTSLLGSNQYKERGGRFDYRKFDTAASLTNAFANNTGTGAQSDDVEIANKNDYTKFVTKSNAILWEDDYIQIGCKLETRNNLGRLGMFYGNKTSQPFNKFTPIITCPGALAVQLQAQAKPVEQLVAAGTQVQQLINFVCVQEFQKLPIMNIKFSFTDRAGALQNFDKNFYLPLFISKFFESTNMTSEQFFTRWKSLGAASQEAQKIFNAQSPMETANIETKLKGFGANLLTDVDPNPDNYVCAGIIHTQTQQIGTLIRLEPNKQAKMYRLTIRSSKDTVVQTLVDLLANQF